MRISFMPWCVFFTIVFFKYSFWVFHSLLSSLAYVFKCLKSADFLLALTNRWILSLTISISNISKYAYFSMLWILFWVLDQAILVSSFDTCTQRECEKLTKILYDSCVRILYCVQILYLPNSILFVKIDQILYDKNIPFWAVSHIWLT